MSAYWPPLENLPTFDVTVFRDAQNVVDYAVATGTATNVALTSDNSSTTSYIPFSKTTSATSNTLYIDDVTTPLRYKPSTSELSANKFSVGNILEPVVGDNAGLIAQNTSSSATTVQNQATSGRIHLAVRDASNVLSNALIVTSTDSSAAKFSVGSIPNPVAGDNAGYLAQNIGASATTVQNQATSGSIRLMTRNAISNAINVFEISTTDCTITTTNNPTITGFTAPATTDNTAKIATTSWVQSVLTSGVVTAATVAVADNNTGTTMYPIFATTGAGQKSLLFDITTNPLSYQPSTSTLTASIYGLRTTVASTISTSGTTISLTNNNIGGTYDFTVSTSGIPLTILSLNETNSFYRVPFYVSAQSVPSSTNSFQVLNSASQKGVAMLTDSTLGAFNSLVALNDSVVYGIGNVVNTGNLVLTTWSATTAGVRITPTTALIGAGGTGVTPTAAVIFSGTTVSIIGDPIVENRNIRLNNASGNPIVVGNGASTATSNIIMTSLSLAATRDFTLGGNVIIGSVAGNSLPVGATDNTFIGDSAGSSATGSTNICIGYNSQVPTAASSNQIAIGTASETMYVRGGFNWRVGTQITATINLSAVVLAQFYTVAMAAAAQTITLPNPTTAAYLGATVTFKRKTNTTAFSIAAAGTTPFVLIGSITLTASPISIAATVFQVDMVCDGTNWCIIGQA